MKGRQGCEVDSLWHSFGSPVEYIPSQDAPDQSKLSLLPAQLLQGLDHLLVVPECHVILPLFNLQQSKDMIQPVWTHIKKSNQKHSEMWFCLKKKKKENINKYA